MNLLKTSILNGIAVLIKTITGFALNKILAIYVGPAGYATIGQLQNFIQMINGFTGGAISTAVIKYTAEYHDDPYKQKLVWKTAGTLVFIFSMITAVFILLFQKPLANYLFHSLEYQSILVWFAGFLIFFNFNALFLAILNGKKEIAKLVIANIVGSLFALVMTVFLAYQYHLYGALMALTIYQSLAFFVTLALCCRAKWFKVGYLFGRIDKAITVKFGHYALMALVSTICIPVSQMLVRTFLIDELGVSYAGFWEAMTRLSGAYLMLVTTTLGVYYLPRLSELERYVDIKKEVYRGYQFIFPLAIIGGVMMYVFKDLIIRLLFSESFLPMKELFLWQIMGDILKIGSWILAYIMLGKAMTKLFVITEIIFAVSFVLFVVLAVKILGFAGASFGYMANYALYWGIMAIFVFKDLKKVSHS